MKLFSKIRKKLEVKREEYILANRPKFTTFIDSYQTDIQMY